MKEVYFLEGEGVEKKILEKALTRAGIQYLTEGLFPMIKITGNKNYDYYHSDSAPIRNFGSIYELVRFLDLEGSLLFEIFSVIIDK